MSTYAMLVTSPTPRVSEYLGRLLWLLMVLLFLVLGSWFLRLVVVVIVNDDVDFYKALTWARLGYSVSQLRALVTEVREFQQYFQ